MKNATRILGGTAALALVGGVIAGLYLLGAWLWPHLPAIAHGLRRVLSWLAFWTIIALIIRILWWHGCKLRTQSRAPWTIEE